MRKYVALLTVGLIVTLGAIPALAAKYKIGLVLFGEDVFFRTVEIGAKAAAEELDVVLYVANSRYSVDRERDILERFLAMKVDAVVISPQSRTASIPALKEFVARGIPVICYNTTVDDPTIPKTFVGTENKDLGLGTGEYAVKYIKEKLGGKVKLAILCCFKYPVCWERRAGFLERLDEAGIEYEILTEQDVETADAGVTVTENIIRGYPGVQVFYCCNEGATVGAVRAIDMLDKEAEIKVFGTDKSILLAEFLLSPKNILQATTGQSPFKIGYTAIKAAVDVLEGKEIPKRIVTPVVVFSHADPIEKVLEFIEEQKKIEEMIKG